MTRVSSVNVFPGGSEGPALVPPSPGARLWGLSVDGVSSLLLRALGRRRPQTRGGISFALLAVANSLHLLVPPEGKLLFGSNE